MAQLYTEKEAAKLMSISGRMLYTLRKEGKIHYRQLENNIRYSLGDIVEYEEKCKMEI